jgi:hypothetical protein
MKVYATTGLMEVVCGVFRTISEAKAHLDSNAFGPNPQILTCDVIGPLDEPETVFTLSRLTRTMREGEGARSLLCYKHVV